MDILNQENKIVFFSQNIEYIVVTIGEDKYRIKPYEIRHFKDRRHLDKIQRIEKEEFYNFSNSIIKTLNEWNKKYLVERIDKNTNWSILVKKLDGIKKYAGTKCPNNWDEFYYQFNKFIQ